MLSYKPLFPRLIVTSFLLSSMFSTQAFADLTTTQTQQYLVIATGSGETFDSDEGELGADQQVVSLSGEVASGSHHSSFDGDNLGLEFFVSDNRWEDFDSPGGGTVGISDYLRGAKILREAPDYSGNVAITDQAGTFTTENTDYFASIGIRCAQAASSCSFNGDYANDSWQEDNSAPSSFKNLHHVNDLNNGGVSQFAANDLTQVLYELDQWQQYITDPNLKAEFVITKKDMDDQSYKAANPYKLDIDNIDDGVQFSDNFGATTGIFVDDGIAVIDIDVGSGNDFSVNNTDWILQTTGASIAIFRMKSSKSIKFTNSSIMMSCSNKGSGHCENEIVQDLGAMFYTDQASSDAFTISQSILGGIGLWDFSDSGDGININNLQGCTQLISDTVKLSSTNRLNRCSLAYEEPTTEVPEPSTLLLFSSMLLMLARRRNKKAD